MPRQSPPPSETYAATLIALYVLAEQQLLTGATSILRRTLPTLEGRQSAYPRIRRLARMILGRLVSQSNPLVQALVTAAITEGRDDATAAVGAQLVRRSSVAGGGGVTLPPSTDLTNDDEPFNLSMSHGERAARAIRRDLTSELEDVRFRITRLPDDIYKAIAPEGAIYQVLDNDFTPAQAQAAAWRVFVSQGVTGFTDKSGRDWSLSAYVEMAVRTASARAYNASHLERMHVLGIDYFSVPNTGHPCPKCFPWQSKVLTDGVIANPVMHVDATIHEATVAGLFHPNCRHVLIPVIPGVTVLPEPEEWTDLHQAQYDGSQRQRRIELGIRKAKWQMDHALNADVRREARRDILALQAKMREFIRLTGFARQSRREQVDLTDQRIKMPIPIR